MSTNEAKARIWSERIEAFERSGLSRRAWCITHGLNKTTLDYWHRRLRSVGGALAMSPSIVPIVVSSGASESAPADAADRLQIDLPNGVRLCADGRLDATWLALVVRGIVGC